MTAEQRARLEERLLMHKKPVRDSDLRAALAHIDALTEQLAVRREDIARLDALTIRDLQAERDALAAEVERVRAHLDMERKSRWAYEARVRELDARATAAEQRVRAVELLQATWRADLAATAARLREVEAERDEARGEAVAHEADAAALRHAKAQAEQTAAALREALERIGWHELTWREARDIARAVLDVRFCPYCGKPLAVKEAAQEDARAPE